MATLKCALRRKNASGTYDVVTLQGSSDIVYRPSGRTVEQDLNAYLPSVQSSDTVPNSLGHGKISIGANQVFAQTGSGTATVMTDKNIRSYAMAPVYISEYALKTICRVGDIVTFGKHPETGAPLQWIIVDYGYGHHYRLCTKENTGNKCYDTPEPDNTDYWRTQAGNNNYKLSNIRQWLNSDKAANTWFTATHEHDAAPVYANINGFLYNFTDTEKSQICIRDVHVGVPYIDVVNNQREIILFDKVWLPAYSEIWGAQPSRRDDWDDYTTEWFVVEGPQIEYFKNHNALFTNYEWLRSPYVGSTGIAWCVWSDGFPHHHWPSDVSGVRPCIDLAWNAI